MSFQNQNIGMMDQGYFVSRGQILSWLNELLELNLSKIEQLGSGSVYCQIIDVVHPGKIALSKVNWKAKNDYEFIGNLRLLQDAFNKIGIKRYIDVEKLAKAKYQDNLEFAQWLKRYYDLNCGDRGNNYQARERRGEVNPNFGFAQKNVVPKTYNGTGVIIPKKELSPPKKTEQVYTKSTPTQAAQPKPTRVAERPKKVEKKEEVDNAMKQVPKTKKQVEKGSSEREKELTIRMKDLEDKLLMITEILKSEQSADLKVNMIAEVVELQQKIEARHEQEEQAEDAI